MEVPPSVQLESNVKFRGFILIELLVTISIIGLLIAAAAFSLTKSRISARDAARFSDGITISKALDSYSAINKGSYPMTQVATCTDTLQSSLASYLPNAKAIPQDPKPELSSGNTNFRKCYTVYRNETGTLGTGPADKAKYTYVLEIGSENTAPSDLSSYMTKDEMMIAASPWIPEDSLVRTPYYYTGPYCDTTCP